MLPRCTNCRADHYCRMPVRKTGREFSGARQCALSNIPVSPAPFFTRRLNFSHCSIRNPRPPARTACFARKNALRGFFPYAGAPMSWISFSFILSKHGIPSGRFSVFSHPALDRVITALNLTSHVSYVIFSMCSVMSYFFSHLFLRVCRDE